MSAPYSKGFNIAEVVNVASTINGIPFECAISDRAAMSATTKPGFVIVSQNIALVLSSIAFSTAAKSVISTYFESIPYSGRILSNIV